MTTIFTITLIGHIIFGIIAAIASYAVVLYLLKKELPLLKLKIASVTAFIGYALSWFLGGYYYVLYYGGNVKPAIKEGMYPWAHVVVMEAKEHIFIMLPFATFAVAIAVCMGSKKLQEDRKYKSAIIVLAVTVLIMATAVTLSGIIISGAAR